jgi:hypothetical protein
VCDIPKRPEQLLLVGIGDGLAGDLLDDQAEQHGIGVGVVKARPRREVQRMLHATLIRYPGSNTISGRSEPSFSKAGSSW